MNLDISKEDHWKELIKKARGLDVGFIALLLFLLTIIFLATTIIVNETSVLMCIIILSFFALIAFYWYSKRQEIRSFETKLISS